MFRRFLPLALLAIPLAVACSLGDPAPSSSPAPSAKSAPNDGFSAGGTTTTGDNEREAGTTVGSPLCGVRVDTCTPDDDGTQNLDAGACGARVDLDATAKGKSADASTAEPACRVTLSAGPICPDGNHPDAGSIPNADTQGVDGVACQSDSDCARGFDCVAGESGEKGNVCRRYCCAATCAGVTSHNGGPTFCDVRRIVRNPAAPSLQAPVCMPIKTCTLLKEGDCASTETCAVVNEKGATGCVLLPPSNDDPPKCDDAHCAKGKTCLGTVGDRSCYKLCKVNGGTECKAGEVCTTNSAFQDTSVGVCKPAP